MGKCYSHLTEIHRGILSRMLDQRVKKSAIAKHLGVDVSTIYRELKRNSCRDGVPSRKPHPRVARELFNEHLPSEIKELVDFDRISCEKNTFIDPDFKATEADVLYKANLVKSEKIAYLYLLCEHQSDVDKTMPFRLMVYMVRILEMHLRQYPDSHRHRQVNVYDQTL